MGDSQDFTFEAALSLSGLGQGLPRFARNDISAFFGLFTSSSSLIIMATAFVFKSQNTLFFLDSPIESGNDKRDGFQVVCEIAVNLVREMRNRSWGHMD